jgi:hypothetical protein
MNDDVNDPLDELLAQARWHGPTGESTQRLVARWEGLRRPPRVWVWRATAVAAVIVVSLALISVMVRRDSKPVDVVVMTPVAPELPGRAPTVREIILMHHLPAHRKVTTQPSAARRVMPPVKQAMDDEGTLARAIVNGDGRVSDLVARRFCEVATARSLPLVLKLSRDAELRDVTIDALARLADASQLAALTRQFDSAEHRRKLIAAMLNRELSQALPLYLELVSDSQTRVDALAAVEGLKDPPVDALLATLQGPRADLRVAAAWTLGRINGPVVTRRLIEMIEAGENRREAFIALAASRGSEAKEYLRQAATSSEFASLARSAIAQTSTQLNFRSQT